MADRRFSVAVLEDDPAARTMMEAVLGDEFEVVSFEEPVRALESARGRAFDVFCIDYHLPGQNGLEVMREVMATPDHPQCLLVTGESDFSPGERELLGRLGTKILFKPFNPQHLIDLVRSLAKTGELERQIRAIPFLRKVNP